MNTILIDLNISTEQYLKWYQGSAKVVTTQALDGRRVRFPAHILQTYVTHSGIKGRFAIHFDQQGKFVKIDKVEH